jgi:hypothetical protein
MSPEMKMTAWKGVTLYAVVKGPEWLCLSCLQLSELDYQPIYVRSHGWAEI